MISLVVHEYCPLQSPVAQIGITRQYFLSKQVAVDGSPGNCDWQYASL
jgi:hypothetical protein